MKWLLILAAVIVMLVQPSPAQDVALLQPVQVIRVSQADSTIIVETDTGESGKGKTLEAAMENLKQTASAEIFFYTADYVLLTPQTRHLALELGEHLRPACGVCMEMGRVELENVAAFFKIHPLEQTLTDYRGGERKLPVLQVQEGEMMLVS